MKVTYLQEYYEDPPKESKWKILKEGMFTAAYGGGWNAWGEAHAEYRRMMERIEVQQEEFRRQQREMQEWAERALIQREVLDERVYLHRGYHHINFQGDPVNGVV
jgi:hypothetical protein